MTGRQGGSGVRTGQDFRARIERRAARARLSLSPAVLDAFDTYLRLLEVWNRKMNLTALRDADEAVDRLLVEPTMAARFVPYEATFLVDVGSGGGSPALPLKICRPHLTLWMVESKARKAAFLREAVRTLKLEKAEVVTGRFEEVSARPDLAGAVDVITVRAVRLDTAVLEGAAQMLAPGGQLFLFRGATPIDPAPLAPLFSVVADDPLLDTKGSHLVRLQRQ
jgi:16S rRNA (guanine527-N7)-methyltransferase